MSDYVLILLCFIETTAFNVNGVESGQTPHNVCQSPFFYGTVNINLLMGPNS